MRRIGAKKSGVCYGRISWDAALTTTTCLPVLIGPWRYPVGGALLSTSGNYYLGSAALERADPMPGSAPGVINMNTIGGDQQYANGDQYTFVSSATATWERLKTVRSTVLSPRLRAIGDSLPPSPINESVPGYMKFSRLFVCSINVFFNER